MIVFQAEHNILMHPFHMLGELNAPPSVQHSLNGWTFLGFCILQNSENDKRGIETRLNGGSSKSFALDSPRFNIASGDTNDFTQSNPVPIRMAPRQLPGVYMVLCLANNKRYYGESKNVSSRLSQHKSKLRRNIHEIPELQRDFNLYGEENFEFSCLYLSKSFSLEERVALETELIGRFHNLCYNKLDKINNKRENNPFWGHTHSDESRHQIGKSLAENRNNSILEGFPIFLKGEVFPSISEASRQTNHSRDTIRRWLNDPNNPNCVAIDANKPRGTENAKSGFQSQDPLEALAANTGFKKEVSIYGVTYPSLADAARQRNCSRSNIQHLLRNHPEDCFITHY